MRCLSLEPLHPVQKLVRDFLQRRDDAFAGAHPALPSRAVMALLLRLLARPRGVAVREPHVGSRVLRVLRVRVCFR